MADFPRLVAPAFITPFRVPPPFISLGHSGKAQLRNALGAGREWTESYNNLKVGTPDVDALLAFIEDAWSQGDVFDITHLVSPGSGLAINGFGYGSPLVAGASQTGASLLTDGWSFGDNATPNLASNTGFETGAFAPHFTAFSGGTWSVIAGTPRSGTFSAQYDPTGQNALARIAVNGVESTPALHPTTAPGVVSYIEAWVRGSGTGPWNRARTALDFRNTAGASVSLVTSSFVTPILGTYLRVPVIATAPAGTAYVVPRIHSEFDGNPGVARFDDIYFQRAAVFRAGDVFRITGLPQLFRATADASLTSVAPYAATIPIYPPIVSGGSPADNAPLTISGAKLSAYIAAPPNLPSVRPGRFMEGLTLTFREAL